MAQYTTLTMLPSMERRIGVVHFQQNGFGLNVIVLINTLILRLHQEGAYDSYHFRSLVQRLRR
jgi:hypothetical protein